MIYAQVKRGQKLHLVYEAGEGKDKLHSIEAGYVSSPLCGRPVPTGYRMTINVPLANACKNCLRVYRARQNNSGE
jgi:hypothetical protein